MQMQVIEDHIWTNEGHGVRQDGEWRCFEIVKVGAHETFEMLASFSTEGEHYDTDKESFVALKLYKDGEQVAHSNINEAEDDDLKANVNLSLEYRETVS